MIYENLLWNEVPKDEPFDDRKEYHDGVELLVDFKWHRNPLWLEASNKLRVVFWEFVADSERKYFYRIIIRKELALTAHIVLAPYLESSKDVKLYTWKATFKATENLDK